MSDDTSFLDNIIKKKLEKDNKKKLNKQKVSKEEVKSDVELTDEFYLTSRDEVNKGNKYVMLKLKTNIQEFLKTGNLSVELDDYIYLEQPIIGLSFPKSQESLKFYYDRSKKRIKGEI